MLVYVQNRNGQPLMPTSRCGWVRRTLSSGRAKVIQCCPFTIRLMYEADNMTQLVSLGVDAGSKHVGISATTGHREIYATELTLRTDITNNLSSRREFRRARRNRKTRYRKPRFSNRVHSKNKGWLTPSVEAKITAHIHAVENVCRILPVTHITVETASFDMQQIKAMREGKSLPEGCDYQHGDMFGFWNIREYILWRDGHQCRCCRGRSKDSVLNVHHIESRKTGGDSPDNLVTLCETCHKGYHLGKVKLPNDIRRSGSLRDATFMGIMRWTVYNRLKDLYPGIVSMTYGYITKTTRIQNGLEKTHAVDARCISGNPEAKPLGYCYMQQKVRCHNRQLHKATILKGGIRKSNQAEKEVKGFRLFDRVRYAGAECFVFGRRTSGYFDLRRLDGTKVSPAASWKKLKLLEHAKTVLTERIAV